MKTRITLWMLVFSCYLLAFPISCNADQIDNLDNLLKSRKRNNPSRDDRWKDELRGGMDLSPVYVGTQEGRMKADKIDTLPGQPLGQGAPFDQYAGYVTIDPTAGRELFYYFVESPNNSSTKPLLLWLNGGPGCSSLGYGALEELGPFRVNSDGKMLFRNDYAWNNVANVIFLESPAGVGFSYSNTSSDYKNAGDTSTAEDAYVFLVNWLERFPQYKTRDLYLAGESYAGHYVPQLASTILTRNNNKKNPNKLIINLKGIAIGNAWIDDSMCNKGMYDYLWTHALNSDETNTGITKSCDFDTGNFSATCKDFQNQAENEIGDIDVYNIYAPVCHAATTAKSHLDGSVHNFDPCSDMYVTSYLNLPEVQRALHVKSTNWTACKTLGWTDSPITVLPTIQLLISRGIRVWIFSGDTDGRVPVTASRYSINEMKLPVETPWRPWYTNNEVGGYVVEYKGVTFTTVRGAGHMVPSNQPERALTMISSFLQGKLLPSTQNHPKV